MIHPSRPVVLCILDGWGNAATPKYSAPAQAHTPTFDALMHEYPNSTLITYGPDVGLPKGQMGNSEVGHTNIGAGRVVAMDLGAIDLAIEDNSFGQNAALLDFIRHLKASGGTAHVMGVVSDGGVHGHLNHMLAACQTLLDHGVPVLIHAITDGRDVAPMSAQAYVATLEAGLANGAKIATVMGRFWALDRDNRWERVSRAYDAIVHAQGTHSGAAQQALAESYANGKTDEFIEPCILGDYKGAHDGDGFFCLNFRADRAREIMAAIGQPDFNSFAVGKRPQWAALLGMVEYSQDHSAYLSTVFPKRSIVNTLGEWVAKQGKTQFRLAETEKYPHVTFFLNGGREEAFDGEERFMPPSPKVTTYDLQPEMSAPEVSDRLLKAIRSQKYDLIVVNYANPDMVGHTGNLNAAILACEEIDRGLTRVVEALNAVGGAMILTADHGNCEQMWDETTNGPHTAHTLNPVPVIIVSSPRCGPLRTDGRLADLAPTVLALMGVEQPPEMTGKSLLK